jgi:hypothetical protein
MWPIVVVIVPPGFQHGTGMQQRAEQRLVEQLIAQPVVEALDEPVLLRLSRRDVVPTNAALVRPGEDGGRSQLGAVVADDRLRTPAALANNVIELARHAPPRDRGVRDQRQAFARAIIDHGQDAEAPVIGQLVGDEVQAPALVGSQCRLDRPPSPHRPLATPAAAHRQALSR